MIKEHAAQVLLFAAQEPNVTPTFFLVCDWPVPFGHNLRIVGSVHALGNWNPTAGAKLEWTEGDNWLGSAALPAGVVAFKASCTVIVPRVTIQP